MKKNNFSNWDGSFPSSELTTGIEITNNDTRTLMTKFNLNPYNLQNKTENKSNNFYFRYLYTGREYNIETGNYYYRARIMDSGIGRFTSKDPILYLNLYRYVKNNPLSYLDKFGKDPDCDTFSLSTSTTSDVSAYSVDLVSSVGDVKFYTCLDNCLSEYTANKVFNDNFVSNKHNNPEGVIGLYLIITYWTKYLICRIECHWDSHSHPEHYSVDIGSSQIIRGD